MTLKRILAELVVAGSLIGCSEKNPDVIQDTADRITGSCAEILSGKHTEKYEFWLKFIEKQYPINEKQSFIILHGELESFEQHHILGELARSISNKYLQEPPSGTSDVRAWSMQQMQKNLAEILSKVIQQDQEIGEHFIEGVQLYCTRGTA